MSALIDKRLWVLMATVRNHDRLPAATPPEA